MRIVKKFYSRDPETVLVSRIFDEAIRKSTVPLNFSFLEVELGPGETSVNEDNAKVSIDTGSPLLLEKDRRLARVIVTHELFRLVARKMVDNVPRFIEDVVTGREMVRAGYADDLSYLYFIRMMKNEKLADADALSLNLPWLVFWKTDSFYYDLFRSISKRVAAGEKASRLFNTMKGNLLDKSILENAVKLYKGL